MKFCLNVWLKKIDIENDNDLDNLYDLFMDETLFNFIKDNVHAQHLYFVMEDWQVIGFVYLIPFSKTYIVRYDLTNENENEKAIITYNVRYGLKKEKLNDDYVYTVLTHVRDKVKGYNGSTDIKDSNIMTGLKKYDKRYNEVASKFGRMIYQTDEDNYYEINPNCEDIHLEVDNEVKVLKYHLDNRAV